MAGTSEINGLDASWEAGMKVDVLGEGILVGQGDIITRWDGTYTAAPTPEKGDEDGVA